MTNIQRLINDKNKNCKLFANTIVDLMTSQGFYSRFYRTINELDEDNYSILYNELARQDFKDSLDVVLWLEC